VAYGPKRRVVLRLPVTLAKSKASAWSSFAGQHDEEEQILRPLDEFAQVMRFSALDIRTGTPCGRFTRPDRF